jgi:amidohydrolase
VSPSAPSGKVLLCHSVSNAGSHGFVIDIYGKAAHVSNPQLGVDAIAVANRIYQDIQVMRARQLNPMEPVVIGIGEIHGGFTNNIICDHVMMHGTIRTVTNEMDRYIYQRIEEICASVTKDMGATFTLRTNKAYPVLCNDPRITDLIAAAAEQVVSKETIGEKKLGMGAEDFAFYTLEKPCSFFALGCKNSDPQYLPTLHNAKMNLDEDALEIGTKIFVQFVLDQK